MKDKNKKPLLIKFTAEEYFYLNKLKVELQKKGWGDGSCTIIVRAMVHALMDKKLNFKDISNFIELTNYFASSG